MTRRSKSTINKVKGKHWHNTIDQSFDRHQRKRGDDEYRLKCLPCNGSLTITHKDKM